MFNRAAGLLPECEKAHHGVTHPGHQTNRVPHVDDTVTSVAPADAEDMDDDTDEADNGADPGPKKKSAWGDRSPTELDRRIGDQLKELRGPLSRDKVCDDLSELYPASTWEPNRLRRIEIAKYRNTFSDVHTLLDYYKVRPAVFYQQVGAISFDDDLESRIENDPHIDPGTRRSMLAGYRAARLGLDAD